MSTTTKAFILAIGLILALPITASGRSDTRPYSHFATKSCVSSTCYSHHPSGRYTFPYHYGHRH